MGVPRPPDALVKARDGLRWVLDAIRKGELLVASPVYVARLNGAMAALAPLLGEPAEWVLAT